jgi:hypothetical protein
MMMMMIMLLLVVAWIPLTSSIHSQEPNKVVINCTCKVYELFTTNFTTVASNALEETTDDDRYVTFKYYGLESHLSTGAIAFCMNEGEEVLKYGGTNIFELYAMCIDISEEIVKTSRCETVNNNRTDLIYASSSSTVDRAVIVEPRNHAALRTVVHNVCNSLNVSITIFHGIHNIALVNSIFRECSCIDQMVNMGIDDLDGDSYNALMVSDYDFWSQINSPDESSVLIFQTDSGISEQSHSGLSIKLFEQYHHCGGLFHHIQMINTSLVGNGGFSIRHKGVMRKLLSLNPDKRTHFYWEDVLYSFWCLKDPSCSMCPEEIAQLFSNTGSPLKKRILYQVDDRLQAYLHKSIVTKSSSNSLVDSLSPEGVSLLQHISSWGFHKNWMRRVYEEQLINADSTSHSMDSNIHGSSDPSNDYMQYSFDSDFLVCPINREIMRLNTMLPSADGKANH